MPPGVLSAPRSSSAGCCCACCGGEIRPCFTKNFVFSRGEIYQLISESFLTVKGAALFLPRGNGSSLTSASRFTQLRSKHAGDIQQHLQTMFTLLRSEDNIKLAVRLESASTQATRYMVVVSTIGRQDTEESVVLGMDFSPIDSSCSVGMVLPLWSDTLIHLDGDGGFSVSTDTKVHVFKPVSVQAMWSALQSLHKACEVARCHNYFPGSLFLTWVSYYQSRVSSDQSRINEWNFMQDVQSHRADSPVLFSDVPTERELTDRQIKTSLREIIMQKDLENVTCKEIRTELEMHMTCNLREFKEFIDKEMIVILGQMDSPTEIFDHVFLGSEWNASNLEELQKSGVQYILNVTREIDNFFPGVFEYHNIRVYDEEATDLLAYWNDTYKFISRAKKSGAKCLVHCKMGISRSAATVIAYAMKEYGWDLKNAFHYVKERRTVTKPNPSFMRQLEEYQGILLASKQRHNKLWRSLSDSDLSEHHEPLSKSLAQPNSLGRSDPHNQAGGMTGPSVRELLESLGTSPRTARQTYSTSQPDTGIHSGHLGSSAFDDMLCLSGEAKAKSLEGASQADKGNSKLLSHHHPDSTACSVSSPTLSNGLCDSEDRPSLPPLSKLSAAMVVPDPDRTDGVSVAQSVLVGQPHPPSSVHLLPPSPAPSSTDEAAKPQVSTSSHLVSEPTTTPNTQQPVSHTLSTPVLPNKDDDQQTDCSDPPSSNDGVGHPNAVSQDNVLLFGHSADHINFFSAREKFKGMSHDDKTRSAAVQQSPLLKNCGKDDHEDVNNEGQEEEENRKETHAPVQDTGVNPTGTLSQPEPLNSHDQKGTRSKQEVGNLDAVPQTEAKSVAEESKRKENEDAASPRLYSDWTRGSVRRVTQQLEQRMKQEHETPLTSTLPLTGGASNSRRCPNSLHSTTASAPQDARINPSVASAVEVECDCADGGFRPDGRGNALEVQGNVNKSTKGNKPKPADTRLLFTSSPFHHSEPSCFASVNFLCLEGVTKLESCVDPECFTEGICPDITLRGTWETLWELGAFLQQVGSAGACKPTCVPPKEGSSLQKRVRDVEARIRQAGLTPPSQMKRSASLAKLGCLELLANDLSELERSCSAAAPPSPKAAGDESKKQRVNSSPPSSDKRPDAPSMEATNLSAAGGGLPASDLSPPKEKLPNVDQDSLHSTGPSLLPSRQQYGKTHPLRQLQKRTIGTLYNTM